MDLKAEKIIKFEWKKNKDLWSNCWKNYKGVILLKMFFFFLIKPDAYLIFRLYNNLI